MAADMPLSTLALCPASASGDNITLHAYPLHPLALLLGDRGRCMYAATNANILASTPYTSLLRPAVNTPMISVLPPFSRLARASVYPPRCIRKLVELFCALMI